jgi:hypothetical protein
LDSKEQDPPVRGKKPREREGDQTGCKVGKVSCTGFFEADVPVHAFTQQENDPIQEGIQKIIFQIMVQCG